MILTYILVDILRPAIKSLIESIAKSVAKWLSKKGEEKALAKEIISAVEKGDIEPLIRKYRESLSKKMIEKVRAAASLRSLFAKTERIIRSNSYTTNAANTFIDLSKALEDAATGVSLEEAGIKDIVVKDDENDRELLVTSEKYIVALLLRFGAAVWTQLAMRLTPSAKGWALNYDANVTIVVEKPRLTKLRGPPKAAYELGRDFIEFRGNYINLMQYYREGVCIRDNYLKAASCLRAAQVIVNQAILAGQEIHKYMDPSHLEGLTLGFRGEAQFWQFNVSDNLLQVADAIKKDVFERNTERVKNWLDFMWSSKEELQSPKKEFADCLDLYQSIGDGFAGALKLYKEALEKCIPGKDENVIRNRIKETEKRASDNPRVFVSDPKPIL